MKKLLLIDGSNIIYRAYFATAYSGNLMQNSHGEYTNAVYALANMLNLISQESFTHVLIAFDKGKETFRHKEYEAYKATRTAMPDEFRSQLKHIMNLIDAFGFKRFEDTALEADDIIGIATKKYYDMFDDIEIISNDRDLFQLLNDKVTLRLSKSGMKPERAYTAKDLSDDFNLKPSQIPDLKGLMGDSSDNLPGIPGVGEKTALKLLHEYGNIENILKNIYDIKGKLKEKIETHQKDALLCKKLATIITEKPLEFSLESLAYQGKNHEALVKLYQRLEFHSFIRKLEAQPTTPKEIDHQTVTDEKTIKNALASPSALILETFNEHYHHADKLGFALYNKKGAFFIPYKQALTSQTFKTYLEDATQEKYTYDLKMLSVCLMQDKMAIQGVTFDLLLAAYVINPADTTEDFRVVVERHDYEGVPYLEEVYGKGSKNKIPEESIYINYALKKAQAVFKLTPKLKDKITAQNQETLLFDIELPLSITLAHMEEKGIRLDRQALDEFNEILEKTILEKETKIHEHAGVSFNVSSPKQLSEILFERLKLPSYKKSKTGYSTNIDVLKKLKSKHPIIAQIIEYRTLTKLQSTYVKGLIEAVHEDGKIHTIYKQAFTRTGRLSSIEPNLQNIPIRTELGRNIRKVFIPEPGDSLIAADYSQIELRVLAHMAKEEELIKAFKDNEDIHTITAKELFETEHITTNERRIAKAVNFGIIYGQSAWGLSDDLNIPLKEAERFIDRYYRKFPGIARFMDGIIEDVKRHKYVETLYHRRRYIPEIDSRIYAQRELGKRTAMNAPIQGSAADIIKIAMVNIAKELHQQKLTSTLILQIHDELVFNVPQDEIAVMEQLIRDTMEHAVTLSVPLTVNIAKGKNLDEAK